MANDFRSLMSIMESQDVLNENPFTKVLASLGNNKAKGQDERNQLIKMMKGSWDQWIGRTGLSGNIEDMKKYLYDVVGFEPNEINQIIGTGNILNRTRQPEQPDANDAENPENNTPGEEGSNSEEPNAADNEEARLTPEQHRALVRIETGANHFIDKAKDQAHRFMSDIRNLHLLSEISRNIDRGIAKIDKIKEIDPSTAAKHADIVIKLLTRLINSDAMSDNDKRKATDKIRDIQDEFINTTESISSSGKVLREAPSLSLTQDQINRIFDTAAKFVFTNDLIGNNAPENDASGHEGYNNTSRPSSSGSSEGVPDPAVMRNLRKMGIDNYDVENLMNLTSNTRTRLQTLTPDDANMVKAVGWAFLKSLR